MTEGFDVGLEMSGSPAALHDMLANMAHGGRIALLGIPSQEFAIDWDSVIFNMLTIRGIYGREMYETWYEMTVMLQSGLDISPVITHRFPYSEFEQAFADRRERRERQGRARLGAVMFEAVRSQFQGELDEIASAGLGKRERVIASAQGAHVTLADGRELLNLCANNYLGLANHPAMLAAARDALGERGYGMASVRFICGTQDIHRELEARLAAFLGCDDTILYTSCFDANAGLFETLLGEQDAIISDALNHASIIDGVRLCKARRLRYANRDTDELEQRLREAVGRPPPPDRDRRRVLDGRPRGAARAHLRARGAVRRDGHGRRLARRRLHRPRRPWHARAAGRLRARRPDHGHARQGARRRQRRLHRGRREAIELLRQRSRPYLFSNSVAAADRRRQPGRARPAGARGRRRCASGCSRTRAASAPSLRRWGSTSCPASTRSCR